MKIGFQLANIHHQQSNRFSLFFFENPPKIFMIKSNEVINFLTD